ncbi:AAA domain-containing protein [Streptomyces sp. B5E4]|uniref:DEAD/DEAH box helicase n=1 Tax=Streptomyces sp. B5E4 TaxID=3153568 RepID=UPI00325F87B9
MEYFSPPNVDAVNPKKMMFATQVSQPLPWEPSSAISRGRLRAGCVWQHTVYAGIFRVEKVRDVLFETFRAPEGEQDYDGRVGGDSAVLCFTVNQEGRLIKDSATLSSCAWAVGQTLDPGPHDDRWLTGFDDDSAHVLNRLLELGDGKVGVDREPVADENAATSGLGPVAGLLSRLAGSAAKGGLAAAAAAASGGLGPVAGAVAAKMIEQVGGELVDSAAGRLTGRSDGDGPAGAEPQNADAEPHDAEQPDAGDGADAEQAGPPPELGTKILDVYDLAALTRWVAEQLGVAAALTPDTIRVQSYQVAAKRADEAVGDTFLNSFYADDLDRVADSLATGRAGTALQHYLRAEEDVDALRRFDVRRVPEITLEGLQPSNMPLGRWPADADKPLVLSQQFAINRILDRLGEDNDRGVYAVNGPPGTGKTTMLRDLIAALVVKRAERLATLKRPELAFGEKSFSWRTEETAGKTHPRTIHPLVPQLTGFEIVIASANNGAVENVTLEVPGARALGDSWRGRADYLSGPASLLLGDDAWGAIAARLGRRSNRSDFVERFWWGNLPKNARQSGHGPTEDPLSPGLHKLLQLQRDHMSRSARDERGGNRDTPEATPPLGDSTWRQSVQRFTLARERVLKLGAERQEIADLIGKRAGPDALLQDLLARESEAHDSLGLLQEEQRRAEAALRAHEDAYARGQAHTSARRAQVDAAQAAVWQGEEAVKQAEAVLHAHDARKPGLLRRLIARERVRRWEAERTPLATLLAQADARLAALESTRAARHAELRGAQDQRDDALAQIRRAQGQLAVCASARERQLAAAADAGHQVVSRRREQEAERRRVVAARWRWGASVPGSEWLADPGDRRQMEKRELSAPWMDPEFAAARSDLFLAALDLHRALLTTRPELMRKNLLAAMEVVKGQAPTDLPAEAVLAAWQMLFLVVPVVSTTFASMSRMFRHLGSEALGWLFVDEAGQAAPQYVSGALWRTRRAVVVGDPLQLEPVVTLPWTGQRRLASHFGVDRQWAPGAASVQTLADRLTPYGTWLADEGGENMWLGSPLRVHRRCDRLMFDISNAIAYDGMMVYGVSRDQDDFHPAHRNVWMDVRSLPREEKWNPAEGDALVHALDLIRSRIAEMIQDEPQEPAGGDLAKELERRFDESVFVISPFRDVVRGIGRVARQQLSPKRYGTVHQTQGKEADIVILVLGTGTDQDGSRDWAAKTPNLLNVAVTRARRRLIVIGDYDTWSQHRYFKELARHDQIHRWARGR